MNNLLKLRSTLDFLNIELLLNTSAKLDTGNQELNIEHDHWCGGMYVLRAYTAGYSKTLKFIEL